MTVSVLAKIPQQQDQQNISSTKSTMDKLQAAIDAFVNQNGYLPCPAPLSGATAALSAATYGLSADCNAAVPSGITAIAGATANEDVWVGAIPTRTLNLPDSYMFDAWTNRIAYAVVRPLAVNTAGFSGYSSTESYVIRINDANGNPINQINPPSTNVVGYALFSHGKLGNGATSFDGTVVKACGATGVDIENCDYDDAVFVDAFYNNSTNFYDDIIRWKTIQQQARDATNGGGFGAGVTVNSSISTQGFSKFALLEQSVPGNTNGGTCTAGAWNTRILNNVPYNTTSPAVQLSDCTGSDCTTITLPPGNYIIKANAPAYRVNHNKLRIYNVTASSTVTVGTLAFSNSGDNIMTTAFVSAYLSLTASTVIRIDHYCNTTAGAGNELGVAFSSTSDDTYSFTQVEIWQQ
jgi:hypothetical protein